MNIHVSFELTEVSEKLFFHFHKGSNVITFSYDGGHLRYPMDTNNITMNIPAKKTCYQMIEKF